MRLNRFAMLCVVFALESCSKNPDAQSAAPVTVPRITSAETAELQTLGEAALRSAPPGTKLLAVCGPSMGRSYYVATKAAAPSVAGEAWEEDGITNGRIIVLVTPDGKPKALFRGALGELNDAAEGGAKLYFAFSPRPNGDFGVIVTYPETGLTETYNVIQNRDSERLLLWTTNKPNMTYFSKSGAFAARCL